MEDIEQFKRRRLTPEEVRQGLEALERVKQHSNELTARHRGVLFPSSVEIVHEMREERDRQLAEAMGWPADWEDNVNGEPSQEPSSPCVP